MKLHDMQADDLRAYSSALIAAIAHQIDIECKYYDAKGFVENFDARVHAREKKEEYQAYFNAIMDEIGRRINAS